MRQIQALIILTIGLALSLSAYTQATTSNQSSKSDTIPTKSIQFSPKSASKYINSLIIDDKIWRSNDSPIKQSLQNLVNHFNEPIDSVTSRLNRISYSAISIDSVEIESIRKLPIRWLSKTEFIVDTITLDINPLVKHKTVVIKVLDPAFLSLLDSLPNTKMYIDSLLMAKDTITETKIDYNYLKSKNIQIYSFVNDSISPLPIKVSKNQNIKLLPDEAKLAISTKKKVLAADKASPFNYVTSQYLPDSLKSAVETLLAFNQKRDSILLHLTDLRGRKTPFWLSIGKDDTYRYWVKNSKNDSITIWIGNPALRSISLALEEDVNVERMEKKLITDIPFTTLKPSRVLAKVKPLKEIPIYWVKGLNSSFSLNQNYLSNWVKGGESSLQAMLDINGKADYNNKEAKTKWINSGRMRFGTTRTKQHGYRTNTDILEANSQFNKVLMDKLDFSSVFYMKTQMARGYNYPNDSVVVSKFLNPGSFTIGAGMEYKPDKNTGINFSILSYRNTFVLDTARINQTVHGVENSKRARHEMGGQLVVKNKMTILKDMEITNSLRLFSNYLKNPQNVDVDWELGIEKQISWYFKIRFNLHLIYDDDIRFPMLDKNDQPVLLPDGSAHKVPKPQLNQLMGLTLSFKI